MKLTKRRIRKILDDHVKWLRGESNGVKADFTGADLQEVDLRGEDLMCANFLAANLNDADLSEADLRGAFLNNAHLYGAILDDADLRHSSLSGADLRHADLSNVNLGGATLDSINLKGANLRGVCDGDEPLVIFKTILGLRWDILIYNLLVTVGYETKTYDEWKEITKEELIKLDKDALDFYPVLMSILDYEYGQLKE